MRRSNSLLIAVWLSAITVAACRPSEVRYFNIWPASLCEDVKPRNETEDGRYYSDPCNPKDRFMYDICGDGTYCQFGYCGKFLGKEKMCCNGKGYNSPVGSVITGSEGMSNLKLECQDYAKVLENYDFEKKGAKPQTKDCQSRHWDENYPMGIEGYEERNDVWINRSPPKHCCSIEKDSINLYTNETANTIEKALCIPPLDDDMANKASRTRLSGCMGYPPLLSQPLWSVPSD